LEKLSLSIIMASNVSLYLLASIVTVFLYIRKKRSPLLPLPPGPHGYPVIGNVYDIPQEYAWIAYSKWAKKYGNIMHFNIFGTHTIILNSIKSATDLLDKRSFNYSDRPRMVSAFSDILPMKIRHTEFFCRSWQMKW